MMFGEGYGKLILFGEHFVVYGKKAIVSGLRDLKTVVEVKEGSKLTLHPKGWDRKDVRRAIRNMVKRLGIKENLEIKIKRTVPLKQNLGSSSAFCVAFVRAINKLYDYGLKDEDIIQISLEGEKVFHGTPSGIDNTASTLGKLMSFKKNKRLEYVEIEIGRPLHISIIPTGEKKPPTSQLVKQFREIKERNDIYKEFLNLYEKLIKKATIYIKEGNLKGIGELMNINHSLLYSFNLSTPKIERIRETLIKEGALGAKITGAGKGGNIIALFGSKKKAINAASKSRGIYTKIQ